MEAKECTHLPGGAGGDTRETRRGLMQGAVARSYFNTTEDSYFNTKEDKEAKHTKGALRAPATLRCRRPGDWRREAPWCAYLPSCPMFFAVPTLGFAGP